MTYTLTPPQGEPTSHVIVAYDRVAKEITTVTPTNDTTEPVSNDQLNYTVWEWDRWFGVRRQPVEKVKR